jgi:RNA polymerase sigma-70 factor (ECF subfamily)
MSPGEEEAFCRELVPRVRAFALRRTHDPVLAADVAQEVALIVLEALRNGRVEDPSRLSAFVLGVARNVLVSTRRSERRRGALLDQFAPTLADVDHIKEHGPDRQKVERCFEKLAPRAKTVVALTFFADCTAEEIARELGLAQGNVRVLRHRALSDLYRCMGGVA